LSKEKYELAKKQPKVEQTVQQHCLV